MVIAQVSGSCHTVRRPRYIAVRLSGDIACNILYGESRAARAVSWPPRYFGAVAVLGASEAVVIVNLCFVNFFLLSSLKSETRLALLITAHVGVATRGVRCTWFVQPNHSIHFPHSYRGPFLCGTKPITNERDRSVCKDPDEHCIC